jgi:zinc D-Ala-D-Ala carboxypeptidase
MLHFDISEFDSPDEKGSGSYMQSSTLQMLDDARAIAGIPFKINSGFRTKSHNAYIGGVRDSSHCYGYAVDVHCTDSRGRAVIINALRKAGFTRFGVANTFIHCDNDPDKDANVMWLY